MEKKPYILTLFSIFSIVMFAMWLLAIKLKVKMSLKMNIAWKIFSPNHSFITFITLLSTKLHNLWQYKGQISPFSFAVLPVCFAAGNRQSPLKPLPPAKALPVTCIFSSDKSSDFLKFIVFFIQRFRHYKMGFVKTKPEFVQKV